ARGVVGDRVLDADLPVLHARVDDLEAGRDVVGGVEDVLVGDVGALQALLEHEGDLALRARLDELRGDRHRGAVLVAHGVGEVAEVRLVDVQHLLDGLARDANLLADDLLAVALEAVLQDARGDRVGVVDREIGVTIRERVEHVALAERAVELVAEGLVAFGAVHVHPRVPSRKRTQRSLKSWGYSTITQWPHSLTSTVRLFLQRSAIFIAPLAGQNLSFMPQRQRTGASISERRSCWSSTLRRPRTPLGWSLRIWSRSSMISSVIFDGSKSWSLKVSRMLSSLAGLPRLAIMVLMPSICM